MPPRNVLDPYFVEVFPRLPPHEQRTGVDILKDKCARIEGAGSIEAQLTLMGHRDALTLPEDKRKAIVAAGLDRCYWQLAKFLRYSTPSRIEEAAPYIKKVLAHFAAEKPGQTDVIPALYLGVALHKTPGQEAAALAAFTGALRHGVDLGSTNTVLWARACLSRLLRRMGQPQAAEEQESFIRNWFRCHKFGIPQSAFLSLVTDPKHQGKDFIMEHPEMKKLCEGVVESGTDTGVHLG